MKKILATVLCLTTILAMLTACSGGSEGGSGSDALNLNLSVPDAESASITVAAQEYAKRVNEQSGGSMNVKVYPNGSLYGGDGSAGIKQLGAGSLDMLCLAGSLYANFIPEFNVVSIPYLFDDFDQMVDYVNSDLGDQLLASVSELGIQPLGMWTRSFRQITNSTRPITQPDDLKGVILRVPNNPLWVEFFTACGTTSTPMSFSEVYNALQLQTLDGQENPVDVPVSSKFYEVQKYLTMSNHMADTWVVGMNSSRYNKLTEEEQKLLTDLADEMQQWKIDYDNEEDAKAIQTLKDNGMEVNELTPEGQAKFVEVSKSLYESTFRGLVDNDELFDATLEFVGKAE